MTNFAKQNLIDAINWDSDWDDLNDNDKCNFLSLNGIGFLSADNKDKVIRQFNIARMIVENRGVENLILYV